MIPPSSRSKKGFHDGQPQGNEPGRPTAAAGRPGIRGNGVAFAARDTAPRGGDDLPRGAPGPPLPTVAESASVCGARQPHSAGAGTVRVLRLTRTSPRLLRTVSPTWSGDPTWSDGPTWWWGPTRSNACGS